MTRIADVSSHTTMANETTFPAGVEYPSACGAALGRSE